MIELLSDHLYSSPDVYIRELLQNGVDAIRAREKIDQTYQAEQQGKLELKLINPAKLPWEDRNELHYQCPESSPNRIQREFLRG